MSHVHWYHITWCDAEHNKPLAFTYLNICEACYSVWTLQKKQLPYVILHIRIMFNEALRGFALNEEFSHNNTLPSVVQWTAPCFSPFGLGENPNLVRVSPLHWYCSCVRFPVPAALQWKMTMTFSLNNQSGLRCTFPCPTLSVRH